MISAKKRNFLVIFWRWWYILMFGFLVSLFSFFLRTYKLSRFPLFADEAIYIRWAQIMKNEVTLRFLPLSDGKQPLFMWLLIPFLKIFDHPVFAGRFLSVLSGMGTSVGVFLGTYLLFKRKDVAFLAFLIYHLCPFALFFDRLALVDSLLTMFGIWIFVGGIILSRSLRLDVSMINGFLLGGALLTKSPAIYFALLFLSSVIFLEKKKDFWKLLLLFIPVYFLGYLFYNILRLGPNFHLIALRNKDYVYPLRHLLTSPFDPLLPFLDRIREYYLILGTYSLSFAFILGLILGLKNYRKETFYTALWFFVPIFISAALSKTMTARYVLFSLPFFVIIASSVLLFGNNLVKNAFVFLLILFFLESVSFSYFLLTKPEALKLPRSERSGYLEEWTAGYGLEKIANYLRSEYEKEPQRKIVVGTEGYFGTLPNGIEIFLDDLKEITIIGVDYPIKEIPKSLKESLASGNKTYLLVHKSRLLADPNLLPLSLIESYPKALTPDGKQEVLYFFQVVNR